MEVENIAVEIKELQKRPHIPHPHTKTCLVDYRPKQEHVKSVKYKEGWGNCLHD